MHIISILKIIDQLARQKRHHTEIEKLSLVRLWAVQIIAHLALTFSIHAAGIA